MQTITMQLDVLFQDWREHIGAESINFAEDGIIDESKWNEAPRKVLFLLKEVNNSKGDSAGNFREIVKNGPWPVIGQWAYGIQRTSQISIPSFTEANDEENRKQGCLSSAILNLKKVAGGSSANEEEIQEAVGRDKDLIRKQIDLIQPSIIVCCATFHYLKEIYDVFKHNYLDPDRKCLAYNNKVWIDYCHPSARFRHDMMYYALINYYRNTLCFQAGF